MRKELDRFVSVTVNGKHMGVWDFSRQKMIRGYEMDREPEDQVDVMMIRNRIPLKQKNALLDECSKNPIAHYPDNRSGGSRGRRTHRAW